MKGRQSSSNNFDSLQLSNFIAKSFGRIVFTLLLEYSLHFNGDSCFEHFGREKGPTDKHPEPIFPVAVEGRGPRAGDLAEHDGDDNELQVGADAVILPISLWYTPTGSSTTKEDIYSSLYNYL